MDFLKINTPVSLGIALSLSKVSTHLGRAFIPSVRFENFNFFSALRKRIEQLRVMWKVYQKS